MGQIGRSEDSQRGVTAPGLTPSRLGERFAQRQSLLRRGTAQGQHAHIGKEIFDQRELNLDCVVGLAILTDLDGGLEGLQKLPIGFDGSQRRFEALFESRHDSGAGVHVPPDDGHRGRDVERDGDRDRERGERAERALHVAAGRALGI